MTVDVTSHFTRNSAGRPIDAGMYFDVDETPVLDPLEGITFRAFMGRSLLVNRAELAPDTTAPIHTHVEEQLFIVLDGTIEFDLDRDVRVMGPGDMVLIPSWMPHGGRTLEGPCVGVDVFSPPRATLAPHATRPGGR